MPGGYRRRHRPTSPCSPGRDPPHRGDPHRRRPGHQRHRRRLRTPTADAEEIKIRHGVAMHTLADASEMIEVPGVGDRPPRKLSRQALADVIEPRVCELYELVQAELRRSGYEELLSSGIVLSGGAAVMQGMVELGEEVFPCRCASAIRATTAPLRGGLRAALRQRDGIADGRAAQKRRGMQARQTRNVGAGFRGCVPGSSAISDRVSAHHFGLEPKNTLCAALYLVVKCFGDTK